MGKTLKVISGAPDRPLVIGDVEIPCYVLEGEMRVLTQSGMFSGLGLARRGLVQSPNGALLPRFAASKAINPFISNDLIYGLTNPIRFRGTGSETYGFPATILADICDAVLDARNANALNRQQKALADRCEKLLRGFARVGIIALVDEVTGYQEIRARKALATILEKFIAKELQPWTQTFPYEFYEQIFRLKGWPGPDGAKRPSVIGHYTNDLVYNRLAPGILDELNRINPTISPGRRRDKHHQWFTPDPGLAKLNLHIAGVMALMRASPNWDAFRRLLQRSFPKKNEQMPLALGDDE